MLSPSPSCVTVGSLDRFQANLQSLVAEKAKTLPSLRYCDLRIEVREEKGARRKKSGKKRGESMGENEINISNIFEKISIGGLKWQFENPSHFIRQFSTKEC
jgi:NAD+--asparagine ADP-ribosyltransferase